MDPSPNAVVFQVATGMLALSVTAMVGFLVYVVVSSACVAGESADGADLAAY